MRITLEKASTSDLKDAAKKFRRLPKEFRRTLQRYQLAEFTPIWREEIARNANAAAAPLPTLFKTGNTVAVGVPTYLRAANSRKKSGSTSYTYGELAPWYEFGANNPQIVTRYWRRSHHGGRHQVSRHVSRALPARRRSGYITGKAIGGFKVRAARLHAQTLTRAVYEILNER